MKRMKLSISKLVTLMLALLMGVFLSTAQAADKPTVTIGYNAGWDDSVTNANIMEILIKDKLGYPVKLSAVDAAMMFTGLARGDIDVSPTYWLPYTHANYKKRFGSQLEILGTNYDGARSGLAVPDYMDTKSIEDLAKQGSEYGNKIVGIDPGAGIMQASAKAISDYGLKYQLQTSSGMAMTVALGRAIQDKKPIVVTGWTPHWMFNRWKLHFLDDPKNVFGSNEKVYTVAHPGFEKKAPEVADFMKKFSWQKGEMESIMLSVEGGEDPHKAAQEWLDKHPQRVAEWLGSQ